MPVEESLHGHSSTRLLCCALSRFTEHPSHAGRCSRCGGEPPTPPPPSISSRGGYSASWSAGKGRAGHGGGVGGASLMTLSEKSTSRAHFVDQHRVPPPGQRSARCPKSLDHSALECVLQAESDAPGLELGSVFLPTVSLPLSCPHVRWLAPRTPSELHTHPHTQPQW